MDIKKLKEEIHKESYRSDPRSLIDVIEVDTLIDIIEELQAKNNEVLDLVSDTLQNCTYCCRGVFVNKKCNYCGADKLM